MGSLTLSTWVVVWICFSLSVVALSIYFSRVYLPRKIKQAYVKSITSLAAAVETKDAGTVGHAQRVARTAVDIGTRLGMVPAELEKLEYAALIMDMGKANVPQSLLNKKDPLTPEEWEVLQGHSTKGAQMVAEIPFLSATSDWILHHHEYWDGSGYPDGLKGEDIPLAARILSIAADYDAMLSERPYHPRALTRDEAYEEIRSGLGGRYDPLVAQIFLEMLEEESDDIPGMEAA